MASILDSGLVSIFTSIFVFLLVYAIIWGILSKSKFFGDKGSGPNAIIAFAVAILMAIAPPARNFVTFVAPWYVALFIVLFFILFIVALFGKSPDKDFPKIIDDSRAYIWIIILSVLIFVAGLAFTFGQQAYEAGNPTYAAVPTDTVGTVGNGGYQDPGTTVITPTNGVPTTVNGYPPAGEPGSTATPNFQQNFINTLTHPKVLGILITFFIAAVAVYFLSQPA